MTTNRQLNACGFSSETIAAEYETDAALAEAGNDMADRYFLAALAVETDQRAIDQLALGEVPAVPALVATIKELRELQAPLIDALTTVHRSMRDCVGDEWAMEWLGEVWSQLPLSVRAAAGDQDAAHELSTMTDSIKEK